MNPDELCICGHTYELHFGANCSYVRQACGDLTLSVDVAYCPCKQFVICDLAVQIFEALQYVATCAELKGQTFDPAMDQALALSVDLLRKAKGQ
jgi:hypothetical protein